MKKATEIAGKQGKMLRIRMSKSAESAKTYYCEQDSKEGQSKQHGYYTEGLDTIGRWGGTAAAELGLTGDIVRRDFDSLCDNINPLTGKTLTGRNDKDRTVGYDFTFSVNKSVSLVYALGSDEDKKLILDAFQQSVNETMTEIESGMQARVRAGGMNENRMTGNITYGTFTHFTTRPIDGLPDPHLHSHCFVFNATYDGQDKKWKAGQFRQLKQDAPYYEAVFQSKLAHLLQQSGYGIERTRSGFELNGIEKATIEKFSRRTQEIEDYSREHNITDEKEKAEIGAKTRKSKRQSISAADQEAEWLRRLTPKERDAIGNLKRNGTAGSNAHAAGEAVRAALHHHFERKSVASDKEILATAIKSAIGEATHRQVQQAFDHNDSILSAEENLCKLITTKDALKEERQLILSCMETRNKFRPVNESYEPKNTLLNEQQRAAVKHALSSTDGITLITGKAGTGKTTLMKEVRQGILESGKQIFAFAPSSEASRGVQRSEGFENAETVARLILDSALHTKLKQQIIWIDEAGMLSNRDMNSILAIANAQGARIILSGDTSQHTSVERGDALRIIQQEAGIQPVTVSKIQRQKNSEYKEAVQLLSDGRVEPGFKKLDRMGAIHEMEDSAVRGNAIAEDYYRSAYAGGKRPKHEVLVVAPTHAEGEFVTGQIRQTLKEKHLIGQDDRIYTVLKNRQLTEAEKQQPENYQSGDWIIFHQHAKGIKAGKRLEVRVADENGLYAQDASGIYCSVPFLEAQKFTVYEPRQLHLTEGDKLRVTANGKCTDGKRLFNGSTFSIDSFGKDGNIRLSNGSLIPPEFGHFNLGYVSTSHAAQGKTADKVIISQSSATFRAASMEQFYVSVSRGRQAVSIYTDDKDELLQAVSHSSQRLSATELMNSRHAQTETVNRMSLFNQRQNSPTSTRNSLTPQTHYDGLPATARTEQIATR